MLQNLKYALNKKKLAKQVTNVEKRQYKGLGYVNTGLRDCFAKRLDYSYVMKSNRSI